MTNLLGDCYHEFYTRCLPVWGFVIQWLQLTGNILKSEVP